MTTETPGYIRQRQALDATILAAHQHVDGTLCGSSLIAAAVRIRRDVQNLEDVVNRGDVSEDTRGRLAVLQGNDITHRRLLSEHIHGWDAALSWANTGWPRARRAKNMQRAAQRLGLWEGSP